MQSIIIKNKKEWLRRYLKNRGRVNQLKDRVDALDQKISILQSTEDSKTTRKGNRETIKELKSDNAELKNRIKRLENRGKIYRREILSAIGKLDNGKYKRILESWFIQGNSPEVIAAAEGYTVRHIYRLYAEAIERIYIPDISDTVTPEDNQGEKHKV